MWSVLQLASAFDIESLATSHSVPAPLPGVRQYAGRVCVPIGEPSRYVFVACGLFFSSRRRLISTLWQHPVRFLRLFPASFMYGVLWFHGPCVVLRRFQASRQKEPPFQVVSGDAVVPFGVACRSVLRISARCVMEGRWSPRTIGVGRVHVRPMVSWWLPPSRWAGQSASGKQVRARAVLCAIGSRGFASLTGGGVSVTA